MVTASCTLALITIWLVTDAIYNLNRFPIKSYLIIDTKALLLLDAKFNADFFTWIKVLKDKKLFTTVAAPIAVLSSVKSYVINLANALCLLF